MLARTLIQLIYFLVVAIILLETQRDYHAASSLFTLGDIRPLTAYPTIPQYRSVTQPQRRLAGISACHLLLELRA